MNTKLQRRLNSTYQKVTRNRHTLALQLKLTDDQYRLWDLLLALYDWDQKHIETFGTVEATDRDLAPLLNCSASKVCRARQQLIKKGCIVQLRAGLYRIVPPQELANMQHVTAKQQDNKSLLQQVDAAMQQNEGYSSNNSIVSYKDKHRDYDTGASSAPHFQDTSSVNPKPFSLLEEEDMRWIDSQDFGE